LQAGQGSSSIHVVLSDVQQQEIRPFVHGQCATKGCAPEHNDTGELLPNDEEERVMAEAAANKKRVVSKIKSSGNLTHTCLQRKPKPATRDCDDPNARQVLTMVKIHLVAYVIREAPYHNRKTYVTLAVIVYESLGGKNYPTYCLWNHHHWFTMWFVRSTSSNASFTD
jgi:hypothetical protein